MKDFFKNFISRLKPDTFPVYLLANSYNSISQNYHEAFQKQLDDEYERLFTWVDFWSKKNTKVLDLGCGNGYFARKIVEKNPSIIYKGIDLSSGMLLGRHKYFSDIISATFLEGDYMEYLKNVPTESYDCILALWSMKFNADSDFFSAVHAALKKGGYFLLLSETATSDEEYNRLIRSYLEKRRKSFVHPMPDTLLPEDASQLTARLNAAGFTKTIVRTGSKEFSLDSAKQFIEWGRNSGLLAGWDQVLDFNFYEFEAEACEGLKNEVSFANTKKFFGAIAGK